MIHWVDATLRAWGEWWLTGRGQGSKGLTASWDGVGGGGQAGARVPIKDLTASRTHDWVLTRSHDEQALLQQVYCTTSNARENAATLKMSLRTMYSRLHQAHVAYASREGHAPVQQPVTRAAPPRRNDKERVEARVLEVLRQRLRDRDAWARKLKALGDAQAQWAMQILAESVVAENRLTIRRCIALLRANRVSR